MRINLSSVMVDNQAKALKFYTEKLGFVKYVDVPLGPNRWLTLTSPDGPEGVELVLEPTSFPPSKTYQKALFAAGIPLTSFATKDIWGEFRRLKECGVVFRGEPADAGQVILVMFEDTCGNLILLAQPKT